MIRVSVLVLLAASLALGGCARNLLGGKGNVQQANNVPVGNQLALPPDLQLRAPGSTTQAYTPNPEPIESTSLQDDIYGKAPAAKPEGDIYARYGISKLKPDGTPKKDWELKAELKEALKAEKRKSNPGYGTVFNAGQLFRDD